MKVLTTLVAGLFMFSPLTWADGAAAGKGADLTVLTNAVNFSSVLTGIMAVAATLITLYAGFSGVKWILRMVRSA
jgi:hypothetical protein